VPLLYGKPDEEHRISGGGVAWGLRRFLINKYKTTLGYRRR